MKLNNIFPNYDTFKTLIIDKLNNLFPNAEWLNEQYTYMSFNTLYEILMLHYGARDIRYDTSDAFIRYFTFDLIDLLPDIYSKQQVFIKQNLKDFLSDNTKRAIRITSKSNQNLNQSNKSKQASSFTPTNIVINDPDEIANLPISSVNLNNIQLINDINNEGESVNNNFVSDMIKTLNSDYSLRLLNFMNLLKKHFTFIQTISKTNTSSSTDAEFSNGYKVKNVPYLGQENQQAINSLNPKVQQNTNDIILLKEKIANVGNVDLSNYYNKAQVDNKLNQYTPLNTFHTFETTTTQQLLDNKNIINQKADIIYVNEQLNTKLNTIDFNNFKQEYEAINNTQDAYINQKADVLYVNERLNTKLNTIDFNNYQQSNDNKINELSTQQQTNTNSINNMKWVPLTNITRNNNRTIINLEGKRFIHLQGRFTQYTTNTGSWNNFTPFTIDIQNYNYMVRFSIFDWNTQRINGSIEVILENGNLILIGYNTNNQQTNYYLWGDVLGSN